MRERDQSLTACLWPCLRRSFLYGYVKPWQVRECSTPLEEALWGCWATHYNNASYEGRSREGGGRSNLVGHIPYLVFRILHFIIIFFFSIFSYFSVVLSLASRRDELSQTRNSFSSRWSRWEEKSSGVLGGWGWQRWCCGWMTMMVKTKKMKNSQFDMTGSLTNLAKWWEQYESIMSPTLLAYIKYLELDPSTGMDVLSTWSPGGDRSSGTRWIVYDEGRRYWSSSRNQ